MQKTIIACCVGALFAAGTAAAATYTEGDKVGIAGEGSTLTVTTQTEQVQSTTQIIGGWESVKIFVSRGIMQGPSGLRHHDANDC